MGHNKKTLPCLIRPGAFGGRVLYRIENPLEILTSSESLHQGDYYLGEGSFKYLWGPGNQSLQKSDKDNFFKNLHGSFKYYQFKEEMNFNGTIITNENLYAQGKVTVRVKEEYEDGTTLIEVPITPDNDDNEYLLVDKEILLEYPPIFNKKEPKLLTSNEQEIPAFMNFLQILKAYYSKK